MEGGYKLGARRWLETNIKNNWLDFMETGKYKTNDNNRIYELV